MPVSVTVSARVTVLSSVASARARTVMSADLGELGGIADQVEQDLAQARGVGQQRVRRAGIDLDG